MTALFQPNTEEETMAPVSANLSGESRFRLHQTVRKTLVSFWCVVRKDKGGGWDFFRCSVVMTPPLLWCCGTLTFATVQWRGTHALHAIVGRVGGEPSEESGFSFASPSNEATIPLWSHYRPPGELQGSTPIPSQPRNVSRDLGEIQSSHHP